MLQASSSHQVQGRLAHHFSSRPCTAQPQVHSLWTSVAWSCLGQSLFRSGAPRHQAWLPSAPLQAVVSWLYHSVAALAGGELSAEEGCGALWFHPLDSLACEGERDRLRGGAGCGGWALLPPGQLLLDSEPLPLKLSSLRAHLYPRLHQQRQDMEPWSPSPIPDRGMTPDGLC